MIEPTEVRERGIHELFSDDPEKADWETWGRTASSSTRRGFLTGLGTMTSLLGAHVVFSDFMPVGLIPAAYANSTEEFMIPGKSGLRILNDRPINAETPPHLLNDDVTPTERLFIRNNGIPPLNVDPKAWSLSISGESVATPKTYSIQELKSRFTNNKRQLVLECGGNGRSEFFPRASGNQWTLGAVGCPMWEGVRLRDVLLDCGFNDDAIFAAYHGLDKHASGVADRVPISRGVPMRKALDPESMIVFGMNGTKLHPMNGHPLRLLFGGWTGSASGKWLSGISIRNVIHDGPKMASPSYHVPCTPVAPGSVVDDENMCIVEAMPVKSLITSPQSGIQHKFADSLQLHGHAWAGDDSVNQVNVSIDFGRTWISAELATAINRLAWQNWDCEVRFPTVGYYEVWSRAVDSKGNSQPMVLPGWNPKGYLNNACHRIAVYVV